MKSVDWYKEKYPDPRGLNDPVLHQDGSVDIPLWLMIYILRASGLKSKKNRIIKKVIKRGITELINNHKE